MQPGCNVTVNYRPIPITPPPPLWKLPGYLKDNKWNLLKISFELFWLQCLHLLSANTNYTPSPPSENYQSNLKISFELFLQMKTYFPPPSQKFKLVLLSYNDKVTRGMRSMYSKSWTTPFPSFFLFLKTNDT